VWEFQELLHPSGRVVGKGNLLVMSYTIYWVFSGTPSRALDVICYSEETEQDILDEAEAAFGKHDFATKVFFFATIFCSKKTYNRGISG
jgi:hypothetical protein